MTRQRARLAAPVAVIVAGGSFWALLYGGGASSLTASGYAEVIDHPAAPAQAGRVARVLVHVGQAVAAGAVVAVMETDELNVELETARLALARAKAELDAEEVVAAAAVARADLLVLRLRATQSRDRAKLAEVRKQRARLETLAEDQLVQARDVEAQRLAEANLEAGLSVLDAAESDRRAGLGKGPASKLSPDEQLARRLSPFREEVRLREQAVHLAELLVAQATLRAQVAGTVSAVLHQEGDVVAAGTEVVRIAAGRPGRIVCWVPERALQKIDAGHDVRLRALPFLSPSFGGRVVAIAPEVEEIPVRARVSAQVPAWGRRVEIESSPPRPLVLGEAVHVRF